MKTGNQVQMCVKLDVSVSEQLSMEAMVTGKPKNRIINDGVLMYTNIARMRRDYFLGAITDDDLLRWVKLGGFGKVTDGGRV